MHAPIRWRSVMVDALRHSAFCLLLILSRPNPPRASTFILLSLSLLHRHTLPSLLSRPPHTPFCAGNKSTPRRRFTRSSIQSRIQICDIDRECMQSHCKLREDFTYPGTLIFPKNPPCTHLISSHLISSSFSGVPAPPFNWLIYIC